MITFVTSVMDRNWIFYNDITLIDLLVMYKQ